MGKLGPGKPHQPAGHDIDACQVEAGVAVAEHPQMDAKQPEAKRLISLNIIQSLEPQQAALKQLAEAIASQDTAPCLRFLVRPRTSRANVPSCWLQVLSKHLARDIKMRLSGSGHTRNVVALERYKAWLREVRHNRSRWTLYKLDVLVMYWPEVRCDRLSS